MTSLDYNQHAAEYARHRRPYPGFVEHVTNYAGVTAESAVLEVGCGTANHLAGLVAATGAKGVGVDPFDEMLKAAATHPVTLELHRGRAEELDFPEESFDLLVSVDMIHYVREPEQYFARAHRLLKPGGLLCTATDSEWIIRNRMPVAHYFPATVEVELQRHHALAKLADGLRRTGFVDAHEHVIADEYELTDATKYAEKAYSSLHLIPEADFDNGLAALRQDLARGPIQANLRTCALWARKPA